MLEKILRDDFSFSRKERIAVLILVLLTTVILLVPKFFPERESLLSRHDLEIVKITGQSQTLKDQYPAVEKVENSISGHPARLYASDIESPKLKPVLFYFDPNTLSGDGWKKLGLGDKTIGTIHNYISKGGKFKNPDDIEKIYGLRPEDAKRIIPYVKIDNSKENFKKAGNEKAFYKERIAESYTPARFSKISPVVDINLADSNALIALPGIGSKLAARILKFREKLGGFYSVDQISETYGLPDSTFQKIRSKLAIIHSEVALLNINTVSLEELKQHPYFKWNIASAIVEYRRQHGNYKTIEDLRHLDVVTNEIYDRIKQYLTVE